MTHDDERRRNDLVRQQTDWKYFLCVFYLGVRFYSFFRCYANVLAFIFTFLSCKIKFYAFLRYYEIIMPLRFKAHLQEDENAKFSC